MKIVFASTPVQEEEISRLVGYMYTDILPHYFADSEIKTFEMQEILTITNNQYEEFNTLRYAFQVISSLQTIISILELPVLHEKYSIIFNKNVKILQSFQLFFPFEFEQFVQASYQKESSLSIYTKAANKILI